MKLFNIKMFILGLAALTVFGTSCELEDIPNPNGPTFEGLADGATAEDIRLLATGLESVLRNDLEFYYWTTSIVGREYYDLRGTDPRYTGELLGAQGAILDNNGFLTTRTFSGRYRAIRNANNFLEALANTAASFTPGETSAYQGMAGVVKAYSLLLVLNHQFENGVRLDVADVENPGPFVSYEEGLRSIVEQLDAAAALLNNGGDAFAYTSTLAATPAEMAQFANALAARVNIYQGDKNAALGHLQNSFFDIAGDMNAGVYHQFGASGNDILNSLFNVPNVTAYVAQADFLADAETGDMRVEAKTTPFVASDELQLPISLDGLSGDVQVTLYESQTSPVPIIRNEELILLYAEANIGTDNDEAVTAIDAVRTAAGLPAYDGGTDDDSLVDAILNERRYSLFGEGHRWVDMRRYNRLDQIPIDREGSVIHVQFPRPILEE